MTQDLQYSGTSLFKFIDRFKTDDDCKAYLFTLKFEDKKFVCSKCNNDDCYEGIKPFTKVCKSCRHVESSTSNTLFHKVKFGLRKAFAIVYEITTTAKGVSALQIARKYDINYDTAWLFCKKVRLSMSSTEAHPMVGKVYVDEFVIGGHETGAVGRKTESKKIKAIMAVEVTDKNRIKRVYSLKINNYSTDELRVIFDKHISLNANVNTDEWRSYRPLKTSYNKSTRNNSPVNRMIQQLKSWVRGTHHSISSHHAETYMNEFSFRINRSQWKDSIFHKCVERMVSSDKKNRLQISQIKLQTRKQFVERVNLFEVMGVDYKIEYGKVKLVA
jgi:transposase-like protein